MRQLLVFAAVVAVAGVGQAAADDPVTCKAVGLHICCPACEKDVQAALTPVKGLTQVAVDRKKKEVTFTASDKDAAVKAQDALVKAGFGFTYTAGDKTIDMPKQKLEGKAESITIKGVHDCCGQCNGALNKLFADMNAKVVFAGKEHQKDLTVTAPALETSVVLEKLQKAGFTGIVETTKK